jgi:O-antigen/teichoic acid export membrane protein
MTVSLLKNFHSLLSSKYRIDLLWNIVSFALCGIIGVVFNILIIRHYDAATLGYFNQIYALFIFLCQIAVWGMHLSVQKYVPQFVRNRRQTSMILTSGFIVTFLLSSAVTAAAIVLRRAPGAIFRSEMVAQGFVYAAPGLLFFSLNKILLSYLNGIRNMAAFAVFNFLRFALMLALLIAFVAAGVQGKYLSLIFTLPEFALLITLLVYNRRFFGYSTFKRLIQMGRLQLRFGSNAALGHIVLDINSKVDILVLGVFLTDKEVGIYSFSAFIVDGLIQLFFVFRTNINPILTHAFYRSPRKELEKLIQTKVRHFYKIFIALGVAAVFLYPVFLRVIKVTEYFGINVAVFTVLTAGCIAGSGYIPFQMIFNQTGFPRQQSLFLVCVFTLNVLLNFMLVPVFGLMGSAVATASVFAVQPILMKKLVLRHLRISI